MKKDCRSIQNKLSEYLDDVLPTEEKTEIHRHLQDCALCSRELAELETTVNAVRRLPAMTAPGGLNKKVFSELLKSEDRRDTPKIISLLPKITAAAACFMLIFSAFLYLNLRRTTDIAERRRAQMALMEEAIDRDTEEAEVAEDALPVSETLFEDTVRMSRPAPEKAERRAEPHVDEIPGRDAVRGKILHSFDDAGETADEENTDIQYVHVDSPPDWEALSRLIDMLQPVDAKNITVDFKTKKPHLEVQLELDAENLIKYYSLLQDEYGKDVQRQDFPSDAKALGGSKRSVEYDRSGAAEEKSQNIHMIFSKPIERGNGSDHD